MKETAVEIMKAAADWNYCTKYDKGSTAEDKLKARTEMDTTYHVLRDLGLMTKEEYREIRLASRREERQLAGIEG